VKVNQMLNFRTFPTILKRVQQLQDIKTRIYSDTSCIQTFLSFVHVTMSD